MMETAWVPLIIGLGNEKSKENRRGAPTAPPGKPLSAGSSSAGCPGERVVYFELWLPCGDSGEPNLKSRAVILLAALFLALPTLAASESPAPGEKPPQDEGPAPLNSPWRTSQFNGSLEKVRDAFLAILKEEGLDVTRGEEPPDSFVTSLVEFDKKKFGVQVSIPPPKLSPKYPYAQLNQMYSGKYGLEGHFSRLSAEQTRLDLRAELQILAMDEKARAERWVPRYSNGEVERYYFTRLSLLLLHPASELTPPR